MSSVTSDEMKNIPAERWVEWCATFTNGNRGRLINIELEDDNPEGDLLVEDAELVAIDYDPIGKGNAFVISHGDDENPSRHVIEAPFELWQEQDVNGVVVAIGIEEESGTLTVIRLI